MACVIGTGWCLLDALVTYPRKLEIAEVYESYPQTEEGIAQWESDAVERGWLPIPPEKASHELEALILNQYILMAGCIVVGVIMFAKWYLPRGTWIEGDENQVGDSQGRCFPLESLIGIDRRRWEQKGIAVLHFQQDSGKTKFILDDFKYSREATGKILNHAESKLQAIIEKSQNRPQDEESIQNAHDSEITS